MAKNIRYLYNIFNPLNHFELKFELQKGLILAYMDFKNNEIRTNKFNVNNNMDFIIYHLSLFINNRNTDFFL